MPEITDAEYRQFVRFQDLGTPDEVTKKIDKLERDNATYRTTINNQDTRIKDMEKQVPGDGAVVLAGDEAKQYEALKALGKPEEITKKITDGEQATAKLAKRDRQDAHAAAAKALGMPEASVKLLGRLLPEDATIEVKSDKDGDKEVQVPYVTLAGENQAPKKLTEHLTAELDADTVKLLQGSGTQQQQQSAGGTQWGRQAPTGGNGSTYDPVADGLARGKAEAAAQKNELAFR